MPNNERQRICLFVPTTTFPFLSLPHGNIIRTEPHHCLLSSILSTLNSHSHLSTLTLVSQLSTLVSQLSTLNYCFTKFVEIFFFPCSICSRYFPLGRFRQSKVREWTPAGTLVISCTMRTFPVLSTHDMVTVPA